MQRTGDGHEPMAGDCGGPHRAHRDADEFAGVGIAAVVLVLHRGPFAGEFHLRERWGRDQQAPNHGHVEAQTISHGTPHRI